jgi:hypothetical protein
MSPEEIEQRQKTLKKKKEREEAIAKFEKEKAEKK